MAWKAASLALQGTWNREQSMRHFRILSWESPMEVPEMYTPTDILGNPSESTPATPLLSVLSSGRAKNSHKYQKDKPLVIDIEAVENRFIQLASKILRSGQCPQVQRTFNRSSWNFVEKVSPSNKNCCQGRKIRNIHKLTIKSIARRVREQRIARSPTIRFDKDIAACQKVKFQADICH